MKHYFPSTLLPVYAPSRGCYLPVESLRATRPISFVALVPLTQVRSLFASRGSMLPSLLYQRIVLAAARAGGVHLDFRLYSQSRWCPCNVDFDTVSSPSHALPCRIDPIVRSSVVDICILQPLEHGMAVSIDTHYFALCSVFLSVETFGLLFSSFSRWRWRQRGQVCTC